jgi:hypothetical protein
VDEAYTHTPGVSLNTLQQQLQHDVPHRSSASSPETWSQSSSVAGRPASAVTASAASGITTQAALRRLLGFDKDPVEYGQVGVQAQTIFIHQASCFCPCSEDMCAFIRNACPLTGNGM